MKKDVLAGYRGDISTEHSSSELKVIGTNVYPVDSYFLHQLTISPDNL